MLNNIAMLGQVETYLRSRHSSGETWKQIADSFGVTHPALRMWLVGKREMPRMALILARLLARQQGIALDIDGDGV